MENSLIFALVIIVLILFSFSFLNQSLTTEIVTTTTIQTTTTTLPSVIAPRIVELKVPAIDNEGNGVVTTLKVEVRDAEGRVLADVNNLLFWVDTQYSIRVAQRVAQNKTTVNISSVDLIYGIETDASLIEGPSAGAALTIATIAALENKTLNPNVMMTGTINPDGTIGRVGGILEKVKAAKEAGATIFLVPEGQSSQTYYKPVESCEKVGSLTYCTTEYKKEKVNVTETAGIDVVEVSDVGDALKYFLS